MREQARAKPRRDVDEGIEVRRVRERGLERRIEPVARDQLLDVIEAARGVTGCHEPQPRRIGLAVKRSRFDVDPAQNLRSHRNSR